MSGPASPAVVAPRPPAVTPLIRLPGHGWKALYVKDETKQVSGAFKYRGSAHKLSLLDPGVPLTTASTGNHALGLAVAAAQSGAPLTVYVPRTTPRAKLDAVAAAGAAIVPVDGGYEDCEAAARAHAERHRASFVHSFDDPDIVEGHRGLYREVSAVLGMPDVAFVPVGGGGLATAGLLEWPDDRPRLVGVEYAGAPAMRESLACGERVLLDDALGMPEGLLVRQVGRLAFEVCSRRRLQVVAVDEALIGAAMRLLWREAGIRAEGAGAAALAAALLAPEPSSVAVCVASGGNIDESVWAGFVPHSDLDAGQGAQA